MLLKLIAGLLAIGAAVIVSACVKSSPPAPVKEAPPPQQQEAPVPTAKDIRAQQEAMGALPAPTQPEVLDTLKRVYNDVLVAEAGGTQFVVGDFNGDLSQDIAIVARPVRGKLAEINDEFANWILGDVLAGVLPEPQVKVNQPGDRSVPDLPHVVEDDVLLALYHGYESAGWRNPEAQQTYLLRHAVGTGMKISSRKEVHSKSKRVPVLKGDVITQNLAGSDGFIFYAGGRYVWYDPRRFKGLPLPGMVHETRK